MSGERRPGRGASAGGGPAALAHALPAGFFRGAPFAPAGSELFASHTCLGCGTRAATWAAFLAHRGACRRRGQAAAAGSPVAVPDVERAERDPFPAAAPDALRALEGWRRRLEETAAGSSRAVAALSGTVRKGPRGRAGTPSARPQPNARA